MSLYLRNDGGILGTMNVYKAFPTCSYSGGMVLVAANNIEEAIDILDLGGYGSKSFLGISTPVLIEGLSMDVDKPQYIAGSCYVE